MSRNQISCWFSLLTTVKEKYINLNNYIVNLAALKYSICDHTEQDCLQAAGMEPGPVYIVHYTPSGLDRPSNGTGTGSKEQSGLVNTFETTLLTV